MNKKAFTLFELLIALAVSALVASGIFSMFSAVADIRDSSIAQSDNTLIIQAITKLLNRDTRMMLGNSLSLDTSETPYKLKFNTQNSLRFNKSVPAEVTYYIEDNWLWRREMNTELLYDMEMPLLPNVTHMTIEFYNGDEYKEEAVRNAKVIRLTITVNGSPIQVLAARTVDNI
ncbi:MAG: prepilin-type N-terminal cleavage/methylation domain-containing protein [Deferribacterales bacterium]|nr:prepilin-type N-terminal cleavage/methylation domain-containing protein [Deferribacterales bacterium]